VVFILLGCLLKRGNVKLQKSFFIISLAACLASSLLFFTSLDNKFLDLFLRFLPSLTENEKVIVLTLDDTAMENAGGFPFRREMMADIVILLKELGVESIVFDLSYLDESANRFDSQHAIETFVQYYNLGYTDPYDIISVIPFFGRDVDEYFAKTLAFSGNSWLTLTMLPIENVFDINLIFTNEEKDSYLFNNIAAKNITAKGDTKTPVAADITPAIQKLLNSVKGAGFVNASPDSDGFRRRVHLLWKYKDEYYKQLTLAAIQEKLGYDSIEVTNRTIKLNMNDGSVLRIPRAHDGSVLLKWPKKIFYEYNYLSLASLVNHVLEEAAFANNIMLMDDNGFFSYWNGISPLHYYLLAENIKNDTLRTNSTVGDDWLIARSNFFLTIEGFLYGDYEQNILTDVEDFPDIADFVRELFDVCREQFENIINIRREASILNGSFSIIGSDATSMTDHGTNTFQEIFPNVGSYAVIANMLLAGDFITDVHWLITLIIALFYALLIGFLVNRFDTHLSIITGICGVIILCTSFVIFFMISKIYLGLAVPLVSTAVTFVTIMVSKFLATSHEKAFLHNAFSRYLAPEVITEIINDPNKLNLGGEKREMTAIFTDIQGFSTISEQLDPVHLVKLLNRYLTLMSNIVMENVGTIDKYEGDAIIAFFGAPVFRENHAVLACRSAVAMKDAEKELNKTVVEEGLSPVPLFTRIGINTGDMVVGNMGAENKMDYTIMGNAVNLAARLEGVNKQYRTGGILISEYTRAKIGDEFLQRRLDRVRVVGINTPLRLYEILGIENDKLETKTVKTAIEVWEKAIDLYEDKNFIEAEKLFSSILNNNPNDKVAELYIDRIKKYLENPPPADWDAVRNLTEK